MSNESSLVPVDEMFQSLLRRAQALQASREKLDKLDASREAKALQQANLIASRAEWRPIRAVALIEDQTCQECGSITQLFRGFGVLMKRQLDATTRIVSTAGLDQGLPAERYLLHTLSEACLECLPERNL